MNPSDLTGRDLDLAVARLLWYGGDVEHPEHPCHERGGCAHDPARIPELFAEIAARVPMSMVVLARLHDGTWLAQVAQAFVVHECRGSTPNEALARLLLMVTER